ncbi:HAD family phosphatase [Pseudoalteromonas sp. DL2-H2.2]|uniref:HAD family hydrolase n=1 Tax=Pseudoalteromonas sp. DL2-H2.2 TaxID=2908889 RepID=UPI001F3EFC34|nr:HAD family phosphatase [Pseudoalteromonas sp. DL2-H2.2]MCF2907831.1 HAD family phosphatase [Pseudoalteromonas sp. DL2-H2.2]
MSLKAILFDFDGTLADSEALHYHSWLRVLAPFGIEYSEQAFCDEFSGVPTLKTAQVLRERHQLSSDASTLCEEKNRLFVDTAATMQPRLMPYAREILEFAAQQGKLALVTGSTRAEAIPVLEHYKLAHFFDCIVTKDDVTQPKPHPEPYQQALCLLQLEPEQAIAIEDTTTGLTSGCEAGLRVMAIPNLHSAKQDFSRATWQVSSLHAAQGVLASLFSQD